MAEFAKEDLDAIVSAIGFGIVSDFRSLQSAMGNLADQSAENNRILGDVNANLTSTDRTLERLEKDIYRQIDARQFARVENEMERKTKASSRRADQILTQVQKSLSDLQKETTRGNNQSGGGQSQSKEPPQVSTDSEINQFLKDVESTGGSSGSSLSPVPSSGGGGGGGISGLAMTARVVAAAGVVGGGYMLMNNQASASVGQMAPAEAAVPSAPSIGVSENKGSATQTPTASTTGAVSSATQSVTAATTSIRRKALEKITNKLSDWVNKNTDKVMAIVGQGNAKVLGQLTGGSFTFSKYMTDSSWTGLGEQYVLGNSISPAQTKDKNAAYVASVVVNLAILAYLACRDIYTRENYNDINSGAVQNFDDLGSSEKFQFIKNAGSQIENYVNKLISETRTSSASSLSIISSAAAATPAPTESPGPAQNLAPTIAPPTTSGGDENEEDQSTGSQQTGGGAGGGGTGGGGGGATPSSAGAGSGTTPPSAGASDQQTSSPTQRIDATNASYPTSQDSDAQVSPDTEMTVDMATIPDNGERVSGTTAQVMQTIRTRESGGDYAIESTSSSASGAYQFIDSTWQSLTSKYGIGQQFKRAAFAPPEIQDAVAGAYVNEILSQNDGDVSKVPLVWYTGNAQGKMSAKALKVNRGLTPSAYQKKWMNDFYRISGNQQQAAAQTTNGNADASSTTPVTAAQGAIITPLPTKPTDTLNLAPPKMGSTARSSDEDEFTTSSNPIDARPKSYSANPMDEMKNKISFYSDYLQHHFGYLSDEFDLHTSGELTAEQAYKRTMNPLGR